MNTITLETGDARGNIRRCARCQNAYDWRRSASSSLKMTYCNSLCELADLGFTLEGLLRVTAPESGPRTPVRTAVAAHA